MTAHPHLVIVHAGDDSLHPRWLAGDVARTWDLVVLYQGSDPGGPVDSGDGVFRVPGEGTRWTALHRLLDRTRDAWSAYDRIWLPDDDLDADCATINRMFDLAATLDLPLSQPSLDWNSHFATVLTAHNPNFALRRSSFVEPTATCFSRAHLEKVLTTFVDAGSGAGLGCVWPRLLSSPASQCAILDRVQVRRVRPVRAPDPAAVQEQQRLLNRHGLAEPVQLSYGGVDRTGRLFNLFGPGGGDFVVRLCDGWRPLLADQPGLLGTVFAWHAQALEDAAAGWRTAAPVAPGPAFAAETAHAPSPACAAAAGPAAARPKRSTAEVLQRFEAAAQAAHHGDAGRVRVARD